MQSAVMAEYRGEWSIVGIAVRAGSVRPSIREGLPMRSCEGKRENGTRCGAVIYRCKKCGSVGCCTEGCTNQAFKSGSQICHQCGSNLKDSV